MLFLTNKSDPMVAAARRAEATAAGETLGATAHFLGLPSAPCRWTCARWRPSAPPSIRSMTARGRTRCSCLFSPTTTKTIAVPTNWSSAPLRGTICGAAGNLGISSLHLDALQCVVDIGGRRARRSAAIRRHASQMARRDRVSVALGLNAYNARFASGGPTGGDEGFFVLPFHAYLDLCRPYFRKSGTAAQP